MKIDKNLCSGCGKCVPACPPKAIIKGDGDFYIINKSLCINCATATDIECIKHCPKNAILNDDGTKPVYDKTTRIRSEHFMWIMAIMGAKDDDIFKESHWDGMRSFISKAYLDPQLMVRLTKAIDDTCYKCTAKHKPGHLEASAVYDDIFFEKFGLSEGDKLKFWDMIRLCENLTVEFLKSTKCIPDYVIDNAKKFASPGSTILKG